MLKSQHKIRTRRQLTILRNQVIVATITLLGIYGFGLDELSAEILRKGTSDLPTFILERISNLRA